MSGGTDIVAFEGVEELRELSSRQDSEYWNGARAPALQSRYATLLAERDGAPSPHEEAAPSANAIVNRIYDSLQEEDRWQLADGFSALPDRARWAIECELACPPWSLTMPVNPTPEMMLDDNLTVGEMVASFVALPEGRELAAEWGAAAAPRNICAFYCKIARALCAMEQNERYVVATWLSGLNVSTAVAIARALTKSAY